MESQCRFSGKGTSILLLVWESCVSQSHTGLLAGLDVAGSDFSHGQALNSPGKEVAIPKSCFREPALTYKQNHSLSSGARKKFALSQKLDSSGHKKYSRIPVEQ